MHAFAFYFYSFYPLKAAASYFNPLPCNFQVAISKDFLTNDYLLHSSAMSIIYIKVLQNTLLLLGLHIAVTYLGHSKECHQGEEKGIGKQRVIGHVFQ